MRLDRVASGIVHANHGAANGKWGRASEKVIADASHADLTFQAYPTRSLTVNQKNKPTAADRVVSGLGLGKTIIARNLKKAGWSLGMCLSRGFQRANNLDC